MQRAKYIGQRWFHQGQCELLFSVFIFTLAVPGLGCGIWIFSPVVACWIHSLGMCALSFGIEFPNQGWHLGSLHFELGVLATGLPEKFLRLLIKGVERTENGQC